jgi:sugar lactone lactonase YvrE
VRRSTQPVLVLPALVSLLACHGGSNSTPPPSIAAPSGLSYAANPAVYAKGTAITPNQPTVGGGKVASYSVSPALPAGLALDAVTGILSGTPTAVAAQTVYTITATNAGGSAKATLTLTVNDQAPAFTYGTVPAAFAKGTAISALTPTSTGGAITGWAVTPALPAGLTLDTATGILSGTPTVGAVSTPYTITATNSGGTLGLALTFMVVDAAPAITAFQASPTVIPYGGSSSLNWTLDTGTNEAFSLALNGTEVSGIPSGSATVNPSRRATYTLAATNPFGTTTGSVTVAAKGLDLLAGNTDGIGSLDGPALSARFYSPNSLAVDASGSIYVADTSNSTIRKITGGVVSTLAGSAGFSGYVDGTGPAARFGYPAGVAVDGSGNVYVADPYYQDIRKITPAGVVTTLAGSPGAVGSADGTGSAARFNWPGRLVLDGSGNLLVADTNNHTIRKITPAGVVTTVAGLANTSGSADGTGSAARFNGPTGLAFDVAGNLYISDERNNTLRKMTPAGVVTTVAGLAGTPGSSDGTGSAARFNYPEGLALDRGTGDLYVTEVGNQIIRKVTAAGVVSTVAGTPGVLGSADGPASSAQFTTPASVILLADGSLLIADTGNHTLRTLSAGTVTTTAGQPTLTGTTDATGALARFSLPSGLAVNSAGDTFVADNRNHTIRKISAAGVVSTFAGTAGSGDSTDGTGASARFYSPAALAIDASDNLYVVGGDNTIRKITSAAVVTTLAGTPWVFGSADGSGAAASFQQPQGIAVDGGGNLYVADYGNHTIRKITPAGVVTTLAGLAGSSGFVNATGSAARFWNPMGLTVDPGGNVYVADGGGNNCIRKVTPAGVVTTFVGGGSPGFLDGTGASVWFNQPTAMACNPSGNLYVCDRWNHAIRKITPAGVVTTPIGIGKVPGVVLGTFPGGLVFPRGIALSPTGDLVIATGSGIVQATLPD